MTEQEQIRAIAELDGWNPYPKNTKVWMPKNFVMDVSPYSMLKEKFDYLTSRDALFSVLSKQPKHIQESVAKWIGCQTDYCAWINCTVTGMAEAMIRATGKWKE